MVVLDRLFKYSHFVPIRHPFTALSVAKSFISNIVKLHGFPRSIASDRDKTFISSFWRNLFQLQGTKLKMSSSYHPQTNGQTEVTNRTLKQYLRCFAGDQPKKCYNTSVHSSRKTTPFEAVYGVPPLSLMPYVPGTTQVEAVDEYLRDRTTILRDLRRNLLVARDRMKTQADQHRREVHFAVGDYVYLKLQPYRQASVSFRSSVKLAPRFFGPFEILAKVGPVAYCLTLPLEARIHDVFHVSLLRKHLGNKPAASPSLPPVFDDSIIIPQPENTALKRKF
ncbi:hypothetical protein ACOSP7_011028 [Xanthoceras sorbifolium]